MQKAYANETIRAASIVQNLDGIPSKPTAVSQVRPLAGLEPEQQRQAWAAATVIALRIVSNALSDVSRNLETSSPAIIALIKNRIALATDPALAVGHSKTDLRRIALIADLPRRGSNPLQ
jgi:hypothetical protein